MKVRLKHRRLALELARRNLSLNHWGLKLGLSRGHLSLLLNGKRPHPTPRTRRKLLDGLNLDFDDLFEVVEERAPLQPKRRVVREMPVHSNQAGEPSMESIVQDIRYAWRSLYARPSYALTLILILALGIGANTSIFSVLNGVVLQPLPFRDPDRLVAVWDLLGATGPGFSHLSGPEFVDLKERSQSLERVAAGGTTFANLTQRGEPRRLSAALVTGGFFETLGAKARLGRVLEESDAGGGARPCAVISHALWESLWAGDEAALGDALTLDGTSYQVIGILPAGFGLQDSAYPLLAEQDVYLPLTTDLRHLDRGSRFLRSVGRMREGISIDQVRSDLAAVAAQLNREFSEHYGDKDFSLTAVPLAEQITGEVRPALIALQSTVGFLLLLVAVNLAALQLARAMARQDEVTLRLALGAGRWRLARQFLAEALLAVVPGSACGIALSYLGLMALRGLGHLGLPRLDEAVLDLRVLLFALLVSVVCALLFGMAPLAGVTLRTSGRSLETGSRGAVGSRSAWGIQQFLVTAQVALALVLIVGSGLMLRSLMLLESVGPGFEAGQTLTASILLPEDRYPSRESTVRFFEELTQRLSAQPGVAAAGAVSRLPFSETDMSGGVTVEAPESEPGPWKGELARRHATPGYFEALEIHLVEGRFFDGRDREDSAPVALIDSRLARRLWPTRSPLGKRLHRGGLQTRRPWRTIVGVVDHVRHEGLEVQGRDQVYFPLSQQPDDTEGMFIAVRPADEAAPVAALVRSTVRSLDPDLPMSSVMTMGERVSASLSRPRLLVALLGLFALLGLTLAAMGIYGIISYCAERRWSEIGLRMALGARSDQVFRLLVGRAMRLAGAGLLVGLAGSLALGSALSSLLFQVRPSDPVTLAACVTFLGLVALAAGSLPARRAARIHPMQALRRE